MTDIRDIQQLQKARDKIWSSISDYEYRASLHRRESENFLVELTRKTSEFIDLGVAVIKLYENDTWQRKLGDTLHKYLKEINVSLNRPFILLEESENYSQVGSHWGRHWTLHVPKSPKLKNIVAGLLLVADSSERDPTVNHIFHPRKWEFQFVGAKGKEFKDEWLRNCREDPVFRICLGRLPYKVI